MRNTQRALSRYVNAASDLAESVKRNLVHDGKIDDETVVKLNDFIIAANAVNDMVEELNKKANRYDN